MWVWLVILLIAFVAAFLYGKNEKLAVILFFLFSILDYYNQMNGLSDVSIGGFEIGYNLLALLFHSIGIPFQIFYMAMSAFVIVLFYKTTKALRLEFGVVFLLALYYVFYPTLETLRQEIAIALFFYSLTIGLDFNGVETGKKNTLKYFLVNLIGLAFHTSAAIAFVFYFFKKSRTIRIITGVFLAMFAVLQPVIQSWLVRFPAIYNKFYYYTWVKANQQKNETSLSLKLIEYGIVLIALIIIIYNENVYGETSHFKIRFPVRFWKKNSYRLNTEENGRANIRTRIDQTALYLVEMGTLIQVFISPFLGSAYRIVYYCDIGILLFFASLSTKIETRGKKMLYIVFLCAYVSFRLLRVFPLNNELFEYHLFF